MQLVKKSHYVADRILNPDGFFPLQSLCSSAMFYLVMENAASITNPRLLSYDLKLILLGRLFIKC